jgi:hypothetical protein
VRIGSCELAFGRTEQQIRPGGNVRFASELKSGLALPSGAGAGGRTVLGFDGEERSASSAPTVPPPQARVARAVSLDGALEEVESDDPLGLSLDPASAGTGFVRNLDRELNPAARARSDPAGAGVSARLTLVLEVEAASFEIAALVSSLYGRQIQHPLLRIRIKKPDEG